MAGYEVQTVLSGRRRQDFGSPKLQEKPNCIKRILMVVHQENKAPDKFVLSVVSIHSILSSPPGRRLVALGRSIAKMGSSRIRGYEVWYYQIRVYNPFEEFPDGPGH